jgi:hypothetical protein
MESGAKGCEVVVSGKLRGQRAKSMKFVDGLMIHSGDPTNDYVDTAVRHVLLRQGNYSRRSSWAPRVQSLRQLDYAPFNFPPARYNSRKGGKIAVLETQQHISCTSLG